MKPLRKEFNQKIVWPRCKYTASRIQKNNHLILYRKKKTPFVPKSVRNMQMYVYCVLEHVVGIDTGELKGLDLLP